MAKQKNNIAKITEKILKKIVIPTRSAGQGEASKTLFKMRYGQDWKKYYPSTV